MKANKIFAFMASVVMAGMFIVGCNPKNEPTDNNQTPGDSDKPSTEALTLNPTEKELKVGEKFTVTANKTVKWQAVSQTNSIEISVAEGTSTEVTAKAAGSATLIASVGEEQEFCTVVVTDDGGQQGQATVIEASEIYPIVLDGITYEANKAKVVSDFRVNDETSHLYIWTAGETYSAGDGSGLNYFGNNEGYVALTVASSGWSGGGFALDASFDGALNDLIAKMVANPDDYFFHIGMKSTDNATHWMYLLGSTPGCDVVVGPTDFNDNGTIHAAKYDFKRNGAWQGVDVPMASMSAALATLTISNGVNILSFLSGGVTGTQLNIDACYFYKK